jgi:hypothetical protein
MRFVLDRPGEAGASRVARSGTKLLGQLQGSAGMSRAARLTAAVMQMNLPARTVLIGRR